MPVTSRSTTPRSRARLAGAAALAAGALAVAPLVGAGSVATASASPAVQECQDQLANARVRDPGRVNNPNRKFNDAPAVGLIPDAPRLANGSVHVRTVFHVISDHTLTAAERTRWTTLVTNQMSVLNAAYSGTTSASAAGTPFRFDLAPSDLRFTVNPSWYTVTSGKTETEMKRALHVGDSETLNVYAANIGDGLLGWAWFPKDYNNGHAYRDGVVILDESMPGGTAGKYAEGDTLTHETGHWLMLEHTFANGCTARGDGVADTPREAQPQFDCPVGADTCDAPGLDPIRNFMDYTQDSCMNEFTPGQADRMSDAWVAFRQGGNG